MIGKRPVLALGNSGSDASMLNYAIFNDKYKSMAMGVNCDDGERDWGGPEKSKKFRALCDKFGWSRRKGVTVLTAIACFFSLFFSTGISSYLVEIVDTFVNEFGILILIAIQAIIFTWYYDTDEVIPVLNGTSTFNVGKRWKFVLKYVLPIMLIVMWIVGVAQLVFELDMFKLGIYLAITIIVIVLSVFFVKVNPKNNKA